MTTELEIINAMLAANGEAPVTAEDSTDPAAIQARNALARVSRTVQARGWWFNKEPEITLSHSPSTGEVILASNTLSVDPVDQSLELVQRGTRLYDRKNNTYNIGTSVVCNLVLQLPIDQLPENAAAYIMAKAVKTHYRDDDGDKDKIMSLTNDENEAFAYLQRENLAATGSNNLYSPRGLEVLNAIYTGSARTSNFNGV